MCRYDNLKELQIWKNLKKNYQEELDAGNVTEQNLYLVEHAELEISKLKMKLNHQKQDELYRTIPSYDEASQAFENQNANWKPDSNKDQEFRVICKSNFITGYLAANKGSKEEGVSMELYQKLHNEAQKNFDEARKLQPNIMNHLKKNYCLEFYFPTSDDTVVAVINKKNREPIIKDIAKQIIYIFGEKYNPQLYQVVNETINVFKETLISKQNI